MDPRVQQNQISLDEGLEADVSEMEAATTAEETKPEGPVDKIKGITALLAAMMILLGFAVLMAFLMGRVSTASDTAWTRYLYLFGAAEAVVFTAVGWLFGQEVNRKAADQASTRADAATAKAETATTLAAGQTAKGEALKAGIEARATSAGSQDVEERGLGGQGGAVAGSGDMQELVALARALFP